MVTDGGNPKHLQNWRGWNPLSSPIESATTGLVVTIAAVYAPVLIEASDPAFYRIGIKSWFGLLIGFLWMIGLRVLSDRSTRLAAGELLGLGIEVCVAGT